MSTFYKEPELKGISVKRCVCGERPYHDKIGKSPTPQWIQCICGRTGKSDLNKQVAIDNWNNDILDYESMKTY